MIVNDNMHWVKWAERSLFQATKGLSVKPRLSPKDTRALERDLKFVPKPKTTKIHKATCAEGTRLQKMRSTYDDHERHIPIYTIYLVELP